MFFLELYSYAPFYVWFTAASVVFYLVYALEKLRKRLEENESNLDNNGSQKDNFIHSSGANLTECSSPDCVRCHKNLDILRRARERLSFYFIPADNQETKNDVSNLTEDLRESFHAKTKTSSKPPSNILTSTPTVFFMRGLREAEIFPKEEFSGLDKLESNYDQIYLEFLHLFQSPLPETRSLWKTNTTASGKWELVHLVDQGSLTTAGELCPLTMSLLNTLAPFMSFNMFGNAAFSVVYPQTEISTHCGPTNYRIRCHLGLKVPLNSCKLQVSNMTVEWHEGQCVCFNDAFPHAVSHAGDDKSGMRVVLMIDLWHPDVSESQRKLLDYIFTAFR